MLTISPGGSVGYPFSCIKSPTFTDNLQLLLSMTVLRSIQKEDAEAPPVTVLWVSTIVLDDDSLFCGKARSIDYITYEITDFH